MDFGSLRIDQISHGPPQGQVKTLATFPIQGTKTNVVNPHKLLLTGLPGRIKVEVIRRYFDQFFSHIPVQFLDAQLCLLSPADEASNQCIVEPLVSVDFQWLSERIAGTTLAGRSLSLVKYLSHNKLRKHNSKYNERAIRVKKVPKHMADIDYVRDLLEQTYGPVESIYCIQRTLADGTKLPFYQRRYEEDYKSFAVTMCTPGAASLAVSQGHISVFDDQGKAYALKVESYQPAKSKLQNATSQHAVVIGPENPNQAQLKPIAFKKAGKVANTIQLGQLTSENVAFQTGCFVSESAHNPFSNQRGGFAPSSHFLPERDGSSTYCGVSCRKDFALARVLDEANSYEHLRSGQEITQQFLTASDLSHQATARYAHPHSLLHSPLVGESLPEFAKVGHSTLGRIEPSSVKNVQDRRAQQRTGVWEGVDWIQTPSEVLDEDFELGLCKPNLRRYFQRVQYRKSRFEEEANYRMNVVLDEDLDEEVTPILI